MLNGEVPSRDQRRLALRALHDLRALFSMTRTAITNCVQRDSTQLLIAVPSSFIRQPVWWSPVWSRTTKARECPYV